MQDPRSADPHFGRPLLQGTLRIPVVSHIAATSHPSLSRVTVSEQLAESFFWQMLFCSL